MLNSTGMTAFEMIFDEVWSQFLAGIPAEDAEHWLIIQEDPAEAREEMRAALLALFMAALDLWHSDDPPDDYEPPDPTGLTLIRRHERLYSCGFEQYGDSIRAAARQAIGEERDFLFFVFGVSLGLQRAAMEPEPPAEGAEVIELPIRF